MDAMITIMNWNYNLMYSTVIIFGNFLFQTSTESRSPKKVRLSLERQCCPLSGDHANKESAESTVRCLGIGNYHNYLLVYSETLT